MPQTLKIEPAAAAKRGSAISLCGQRLDALTSGECIDAIITALSREQGGWIVTANLDHLRRLVGDRSYRRLCDGADLIVADGMPLLWASRIQTTPLPQRVAGSELIWTLSEAAANADRSVFLLGGSPGTAEEAGRILASRYPGLRVVGAFCPPVGFEKDPQTVAEIHQRLSSARPDIVYVALGSPKQEEWIAKLRQALSAAWWIGVGISFSFVCGHVKRAPIWMQRCGIEWVHRLVQEPRRLFKRYIVHDLPFAVVLLGSAVKARFSQGQTIDAPETPAGLMR
jgi:N-acetylglucosaminyldiphosphoundecaprenol N-acetyl-beta-D-mannosaminyltransferase